jgi:hypothetical protein
MVELQSTPEQHGRLVIPDVVEIENLIKNDPHGRTREEIFRAAGLCGGKKLRQWRSGVKAFVSTLEAVARVLHGCKSVDQIIRHEVTTRDLVEMECPELAYERLLIMAIISHEFHHESLARGGVDKVEVADFAYDLFRYEMSLLDIGVATQYRIRDAMCRVGWLRKEDDPRRPRYFLRTFTHRQQRTAHLIRVEVECLAVRNVYDMSISVEDDEARAEFLDIMRHQTATLLSLEEATENIRATPCDEAALAIVRLDCAFHLGWAGHDPSLQQSLQLAIGNHLQPLLRLQKVQREFRRKSGGSLPKGYPTLPDLVSTFYRGAKKIFDAQYAACSGVGTIDDVAKEIREHSKQTYDYLGDAEALLKTLRPPGA